MYYGDPFMSRRHFGSFKHEQDEITTLATLQPLYVPRDTNQAYVHRLCIIVSLFFSLKTLL